MKLCTECHWDDWDRYVDIYLDSYESLSDDYNSGERYKLIILEKGIIEIKADSREYEVKAPALILLSQKDRITYKIIKSVKTDIIFFNPEVIREEFVFGRIDSGEFARCLGQIIYQDYLLISGFEGAFNERRIIPLPVSGLKHIKGLFNSMDNELRGQKDGFWPCRSRSYLMEILHFVFYSFLLDIPVNGEEEMSSEQVEFTKIAEYLEQHLSEDITLGKLTSEFAINRNKLNALFMEQTSMTCLSYLLNLRMDLAKIMLSKTELPIGEISVRVGYPDPNYFTKVFREKTGKTPSQFRRS